MTRFTEEIKDRIALALGYSDSSIDNLDSLKKDYSAYYHDSIMSHLDELDELSTLEAKARSQLAAEQVDDLKLNFTKQLVAYRLRGAEITKLISVYTDTAIFWNRYGGSSGNLIAPC